MSIIRPEVSQPRIAIVEIVAAFYFVDIDIKDVDRAVSFGGSIDQLSIEIADDTWANKLAAEIKITQGVMERGNKPKFAVPKATLLDEFLGELFPTARRPISDRKRFFIRVLSRRTFIYGIQENTQIQV